jgi:putative tricarboxylic transport membrane protein
VAEKNAGGLHQTVIGAGALLIGAAMAWGASQIPAQAGYQGVGPNFLPWLVAIVLVVCGGWLVYEARTGGWRAFDDPPGAARGDWAALLWVVAGIAANAALITTIGFILACTLCFMLAVRGLRAAEGKGQGGAKGLVLDFVTGFLIAAPAFWLFTLVLNINLPNVSGTGWL